MQHSIKPAPKTQGAAFGQDIDVDEIGEGQVAEPNG
jgi:hypothetical protein